MVWVNKPQVWHVGEVPPRTAASQNERQRPINQLHLLDPYRNTVHFVGADSQRDPTWARRLSVEKLIEA